MAPVARLGVIGGIIRVSTKAQAGTDSPENQRETLARAGATVFYEEAVSGSAKGGQKRRQSPSWQQLTADITGGRLTKLLVCDVSRIARRDALITELVELCDHHSVEFLASSGGTLTAKTAAQWLSVKQQGIFAEYFARELSDKIKRGQAAAINRGVFGFTSAHLPWHLQKDPADHTKIIAIPDRWETAQAAIRAYISGEWSMAQLCKFVYERHGVLGQTSSAHKWLKSGWVLGHYAKRSTGEVLIANLAPRLISEDEHHQLQLRMAANRKDRGKRAPHKIRALSAICRCAHCGRHLTHNTPKGYVYLRCAFNQCDAYAMNIPAAVVEHDLLALISHGAEIIDAAERRRQQCSKPSRELLNLRLRVKALKAALDLCESPGVRADYQQALARQHELEAALAPAEPTAPTLWEQVRVGSVNWWMEKSEAERQSRYLLLIDHAVVDPLLDASGLDQSFVVSVQWREL